MAKVKEAVERYLEAVGGIDAYPSAECKGSVLNEFIALHREQLLPLLPDELRALAREAVPPSMWLPEVQVTAIFVAQRSLLFPTDDGYVDFARGINRRLLSSPLYRGLFRLFSASRVARLVSGAWNQLHRGSEIRTLDAQPTSVTIEATYPAHVFPRFIIRSALTSAPAALDIGGTPGATVELLSYEPTSMQARIEWQR